MKLAYTSDTHLDFWVKNVNPQDKKTQSKVKDFINNVLVPKEADAIVIAGDIGHANGQNIVLLNQLKEIYNDVIVVNGNHDMYLETKNQQSKYSHYSFKRTDEMKQLCIDNGIHYLDGDIIDIQGVKIGGTGMWYDLKSSRDLEDWKELMNDSKLIMNGPVHRGYSGWYSMYSNSSEFVVPSFNPEVHYQKEVEKLLKLRGIDVFVSHVAPIIIPDFIKKKRYGTRNRYNKFYESDNLDNLQNTGAKHCIFGHTHIEEEFELGGINFHVSAVGYPQERKTSGQIKVLEL